MTAEQRVMVARRLRARLLEVEVETRSHSQEMLQVVDWVARTLVTINRLDSSSWLLLSSN